MDIVLHSIPVRDIFNGFIDNDEEGVFAYGGKLNIRPPYQREFIYDKKQQEKVIDSVWNGFPINVMYWVENEDGTYELLDGQQRTMSIMEFCSSNLNYNGLYIHNFTDDQQKKIFDYELKVYICKGSLSEKFKWFETINIAGEKLTPQEIKNALLSGSWTTDAKRYFSKRNCIAYKIANEYMSGECTRQEYLETALDWISNGHIKDYMAVHQHNPNANELKLYFNSVIEWVKTIFPKYRKPMKGIQWGKLYNTYKDVPLDTAKLELQISNLMEDDEITNIKGIYYYVLDGNEKHLNLRAFTEKQKRIAYEKQQGICPICGKHFEFDEMEGDHIVAWSKGGKTLQDNCQMLCRKCNNTKSNK